MIHADIPLARHKRRNAILLADGKEIHPTRGPLLQCPDQSIGETTLRHLPSATTSPFAFLPNKHALRAKVAMQVIGVGRSKFYLLAKTDPTFPRSFRLSDSASAATVWWAHELQAWLEARAAKSRKN